MGLFSRFIAKVTGNSAVVQADWDDLERDLIASDIGRALSEKILSAAKSERGESAQARISRALEESLSTANRSLAPSGVIIVVGVNGTGKTTSVSKLANYLSPKKCLLAAADTFRAAAVAQLQTWGQRIAVEVISGKGDSAAVAFDATARFLATGSDYLIIDTAGRLHTKSDLMDELGKIKRVIEKRTPVAEVLLVVDATTGQNGLAQAKVFAEAVAVTGLILTKLDGSAKGGIALAIESSLNIPIKFVGTGEGLSDFAAFDSAAYIESLFS